QARAAFEKALALARAALAVNPKDASIHGVIAQSLAKTGRLGEANVSITTALKLDPTNPNVLYQAAVVAYLRGNGDAAMQWLQRAVAAGYPAMDAARDPEFSAIRHDAAFRSATETGKQKTSEESAWSVSLAPVGSAPSSSRSSRLSR
ncbi:MAG: tetratricopeptide repeat protein, partial [Thermoanaerobaculia bacterium]